MKIIYWSQTYPQLFERLVNLVPPTRRDLVLRLQVPEEARAVDFCTSGSFEILRSPTGSCDAIRRAILATRPDQVILVLDAWGLIGAMSAQDMTTRMALTLRGVSRVVLVGPPLWSRLWEGHVLLSNKPLQEKVLIDRFFSRMEMLHDAVLASGVPTTFLEALPTEAFFRQVCGKEVIEPLHRMAWQLVPQELLDYDLAFSDLDVLGSSLATICFGDNSMEERIVHRTIPASVVLPKRQVLQTNQQTSSLVPEGVRQWMQAACSWETWCQGGDAVVPNLVGGTLDGIRFSQPLVAQMLAFLGVIGNSIETLSRASDIQMATLRG